MLKITQARLDAKHKAEIRGHKMGRFRAIEMDCFISRCKFCRQPVFVSPLLDKKKWKWWSTGPAVEQNCDGGAL
jgi:hypothetical protein